MIFMFAGFNDIAMALLMWFFIGRGDTIFTIVFAIIGLIGFGLIGFGVMLNLRDS